MSIHSQEIGIITLESNFQTINPGPNFEIIEDKDGTFTLEDIHSGKYEWKKPENDNANFGFSSSHYWIRFTLFNPNYEIARPILEFAFPKQDYIELFSPIKGIYKSKTVGDLYPFIQREVLDTNFAFELQVEPNARQTYFVKTRSLNNLSFLNPFLHESSQIFHKETSFRDLSNGILYGFLFIMIFYNLFFFFIMREKVYLFLSLYVFAFNHILGSLHGVNFQYLYPDNPVFSNRDTYISLPFLLIFQILLTSSYLELKTNLPKVNFLLKIFIALLFLYMVLINSILFDKKMFTYFSLNFLVFFNAVLFIIVGTYLSIKRFRPAYFYLISWGLLLIAFILRSLAGISIIPITVFTFWAFQFSFALMLISMSIGLADKIYSLKQKLLNINQELEDYSEHLEEKIWKRTKELQSSLNIVNDLKTQQDGDYFLTSLLLIPFIANKSQSEKVKVDILMIQKKKFEFYGKEHDIGGDLCHTQNLMLNNQNYILFFNSDSMGKSLQGAGGAIVFGSVLFSIIERTKASIYSKDLPPERWLKNAFVELHKVFLTFECTMLVSAIIGLVEENTGLMYFINAEHPWIALYADNACNFIEKEIFFTKLGSPVDSNKVFVNFYQMEKNDIILIGSDGRDDFAISEESNDISLNLDENEFLKTVVKAEGNLNRIYEITCDKGKIMDDYSLIRIQYLHENSDSKNLKNLSIENYNAGNATSALNYGLDYILKNPSDTEFLFFIGTIYKLQNLPRKAVTYFERVRLRNPYNLKNLIQIAEIHFLLGNLFRAEKILRECIDLDPTNLDLQRLADQLQVNIA